MGHHEPQIADFLLARIAEDEAAARGERAGVRVMNPAQVLFECEAKRGVVRDALVGAKKYGERQLTGWMTAVKIFASAYADHPDYRDEWRP